MFQYSVILFVFSVQAHKEVENPQKTMEVNGLMPLPDSYDYDLIVIGGGSGGLAAAKEAAKYEKKVMVLDFVTPTPQGNSWGLGGTCVNVGCIPKKLMHQAALLGQALQDSRKFGWQFTEEVKHNWMTMTESVQNYIGSLNWGYRVALRDKKVTYENAYGEFVGPHTIKVERVEEGTPGILKVTAKSTTGNQIIEVEYDTVLLAIGRDPCTRKIGLDKVGVNINEKTGKIPVNDEEQTNVPYIYAVGDILQDKLELTPVAIQAGRLLVRRLYAGATTKCDYLNVPTTVFTPLEYGACGYSEETAVEKFGEENIEVYHSHFWPLEWTVPSRDNNKCYAKIICNIQDNERVIGFHVLGPNAGEVTQGFAAAIKCGLTKEQLDSTVGIHPICAEVFTTLSVTKRSGRNTAVSGC
uniref:Thioredoxin reductase 1, cytoplasmic n=1 Tax=Serinus canaria TaxID=9135 RepID=A0A8C9MHH1_SERCA